MQVPLSPPRNQPDSLSDLQRMDAHFRAFSFVDRITAYDRTQIRGHFTPPAAPAEFPLALVGEAVGQLAAWAAMDALNFAQRPVAGLAGSIELFLAPPAGKVLELAAELEQVDTESVQYSGTAHLGDQLVIRLKDCVGPMVPLTDFDDPHLVRNRFELLRGSGAQVGSFPGLPPLTPEPTGGQPGQSISATFQVPSAAPLFADHFPRRQVFPGSLLMHLNLQIGANLARQIPSPTRGYWVPGTIVDMKLRSFIAPGAVLRLEAMLKRQSNDSARLALKTWTDNEIIASGGLILKPNEMP
jgi:3-hydroxymyristoyl/3-hydroxydecanoyl-(acyl carrier protein) dehydratase